MSAPETPPEVAARVRAAIEVLEAAVRDPAVLAAMSEEERIRLRRAAGDVFDPDPEVRRQHVRARQRRERAAKRAREETTLGRTGIRTLRAKPVFTTPNVFPPEDFSQQDTEHEHEARGIDDRHCYVCKRHYDRVHHFYDQLCPECAELNFSKRTETADLGGRVALLTGGRVKIGYQAGIKLLRAGASVVVTTRFPRDSALRYSREPDFAEWADRLEIFGLDLRHTPSVEAFCAHLASTQSRLDFIVNNACQTVRRPPEFYRHMMDLERTSLADLPADARRAARRVRGAARRRDRRREPDRVWPRSRPPRSRASPTPRSCPRPPCSPTTPYRNSTSSPKACSTRTCSRWTCGEGTPGG